VVWVNVSNPQTVEARTYDATGAPTSGQFEVNSFTTSTIGGWAASGSMDKDFVVAFADYTGPPSAVDSIEAQRYLPEASFVLSFGTVLAGSGALTRRRGRSRVT